MAYATWKTPEVELDGVKYSIVYLQHEQIRLRITGKGDIPGTDKQRPWIDFHYSLDEIFIDEGIVSIGKNAFAKNNWLKTVWIPETLLSIGEGAFDQCPNLEIIVYGSTPAQLESVDIHTNAIPDWFDLEEKENGL